jgi:hypothetical protein
MVFPSSKVISRGTREYFDKITENSASRLQLKDFVCHQDLQWFLRATEFETSKRCTRAIWTNTLDVVLFRFKLGKVTWHEHDECFDDDGNGTVKVSMQLGKHLTDIQGTHTDLRGAKRLCAATLIERVLQKQSQWSSEFFVHFYLRSHLKDGMYAPANWAYLMTDPDSDITNELKSFLAKRRIEMDLPAMTKAGQSTLSQLSISPQRGAYPSIYDPAIDSYLPSKIWNQRIRDFKPRIKDKKRKTIFWRLPGRNVIRDGVDRYLKESGDTYESRDMLADYIRTQDELWLKRSLLFTLRPTEGRSKVSSGYWRVAAEVLLGR